MRADDGARARWVPLDDVGERVAARDARRGGPPLRRAPRRRSDRGRARGRDSRARSGASSRARRRSRCSSRGPGRSRTAHLARQARRDGARAAHRGVALEARDPRAVPEPRAVRRRACAASRRRAASTSTSRRASSRSPRPPRSPASRAGRRSTSAHAAPSALLAPARPRARSHARRAAAIARRGRCAREGRAARRSRSPGGGFGAPHLVERCSRARSTRRRPRSAARTERVDARRSTARLQREVETLARGVLEPLARRHVTRGGVVVVDNATGEILAYVGSPRLRRRARGGQNDGVRALRQPGSTLKPFVYGLAMERLGFTAGDGRCPTSSCTSPTPDGDLLAAATTTSASTARCACARRSRTRTTCPRCGPPNEVGVARVLERAPRRSGSRRSTEDAGATTARRSRSATARCACSISPTRTPRSRAAACGAGRACRRADRARTARRSSCRAPAPSARVLDEARRGDASPTSSPTTTRALASFGEGNALELPFAVAAKTGTSKGFRDNWTVGFTPRGDRRRCGSATSTARRWRA